MLSICDNGPWPPPPREFNLAAHVLGRAPDLPDKIAMAVLGLGGAERWSYARLETAVRATGAGLLRLGLRPGERVLMRLGNSADFPVVFLGAIAAGLIPVPSSAQLTTPEITRAASGLDIRLIVAAPGVALPQSPACPVIGTAELAGMRDGPGCDYRLGDPDRPAYVIFTSGTSGQTRAVSHAHRAIWARGMMHRGWYGLTGDDRLMHAGAFNWTYTLGTGLMDPWTLGATALIPAQGVTAAELPLLLKRHDATIFAAAPGIYRQMLRGPMPALTRLRHGLSAGEKLPEPTRARWTEATGTPIHEAFGMSECSTFLSGSPDRPAPPGSLGYPQPGRRIAILGESGPVARGETGIIAVDARDPGLMLGYVGAPEETAARHRDGWFLTGDMGEMAEDGSVLYHGRADDMLNSGGFRVSPLEIEAALNAHPDIQESAAVDLAVGPETTVIAAWYVGTSDLDSAALTAYLGTRLAHYKIPRIFRRIEALPKGANSKILRRALRASYEAPNDQA